MSRVRGLLGRRRTCAARPQPQRRGTVRGRRRPGAQGPRDLEAAERHVRSGPDPLVAREGRLGTPPRLLQPAGQGQRAPELPVRVADEPHGARAQATDRAAGIRLTARRPAGPGRRRRRNRSARSSRMYIDRPPWPVLRRRAQQRDQPLVDDAGLVGDGRSGAGATPSGPRSAPTSARASSIRSVASGSGRETPRAERDLEDRRVPDVGRDDVAGVPGDRGGRSCRSAIGGEVAAQDRHGDRRAERSATSASGRRLASAMSLGARPAPRGEVHQAELDDGVQPPGVGQQLRHRCADPRRQIRTASSASARCSAAPTRSPASRPSRPRSPRGGRSGHRCGAREPWPRRSGRQPRASA